MLANPHALQALLGAMQAEEVAGGRVLLRAGAGGDCAYIVERGRCEDVTNKRTVRHAPRPQHRVLALRTNARPCSLRRSWAWARCSARCTCLRAAPRPRKWRRGGRAKCVAVHAAAVVVPARIDWLAQVWVLRRAAMLAALAQVEREAASTRAAFLKVRMPVRVRAHRRALTRCPARWQNVKLLQPLSDSQLERLAETLRPVTFRAGQTIVRQGDRGSLVRQIHATGRAAAGAHCCRCARLSSTLWRRAVCRCCSVRKAATRIAPSRSWGRVTTLANWH